MKYGLLIISCLSFAIISCNQGNEKNTVEAGSANETKAFDDDTVSISSAIPERKSATVVPSADTSHTPENSLDWAGTYAGKLPCADCQGIQTELMLSGNKTYKLKQTYEGKSAAPVIREGTFQWINGTNIHLYENGQVIQQFLVAEGQLYHLDDKGRIIKGKLAKQYILKKS